MNETLAIEANNSAELDLQLNMQTEAMAAESRVPKTDSSPIPGLEGVTKAELDAFGEEVHALLFPVLSAQGNALVICERLGGAQMTLSEAVNAIWPHTDRGAMFREGLASVYAEIQKMLANRVQNAGAEEEKPQDDQQAEDEPVQVLEQPKEAPKVEQKNAESQPQDSVAVKTPAAEAKTQPAQTVAEAKPVESTQSQAKAQPTAQTPATEAGPKPSQASAENPVEARGGAELANAEVVTARGAVESMLVGGQAEVQSESSVADSGLKTNVNQERSARAQEGLESSIDTEWAGAGVVDTEPDATALFERDGSEELLQPDSNLETEDISASLAEQLPKVELADEPVFDTEAYVDLSTGLEIGDKAAQIFAENYRGGELPTDFVEGEELAIDHFDAEDPLFAESESFDAEGFGAEAETESFIDIESMDEFASLQSQEQALPEESSELVVGEVGQPLAQINEILEISEPAVAVEVKEIIEQIGELPETPEAKQEIEALWEELFDALGVRLDLELMQPDEQMKFRQLLLEEITNRQKVSSREMPSKSATNELINEPVVGANNAQVPPAQAGAIGRSVVHLYRISSVRELVAAA